MRLIKTSLVLLQFVLLCTAHAALYKDEHWYQQRPVENLTITDDAINFLVVGDWGRNGHFQQKDVAEQMDNLMYWLDGDFIISAGDNFYPDGIASVSDPYLKSSFEAIYTGPHLFEPWYLVLGNHDYRGNVQAQIDYSQVSKRWNMPARYYSKTFQLPESDEQLLIVFLDTNPFEAKYQHEAKYANVRSQLIEPQLEWLNTQLSGSQAKWKIVVGHHPMYSSGKRYGKTDSVRQKLEPILEKYKVDAYFAGHEHDLQHNKIKGKSVQHFISGAGSAVRDVKTREFTEFAEAQAGVTALTVTQNQILIQMVTAKGKLIYHTRIIK